MGDFNSWWDVLGTGIQSAFAWAGFNRDAFADNVGWRQAQKYQQKNYHISWIAVARDDIRDMMSISVNRLNNFMIVNGLILGVAGGAITSTPSTEDASRFLIAAFLVSVTTAIVFLVLAIMFGIKGQNCAFTRTMRLLTFQMRPENPADYNHDYMQQAQWIEQTGLKGMFRIPGLMPNYHTSVDMASLPEDVKLKYLQTAKSYGQRRLSQSRGSGRKLDGTLDAEEFTGLENLDVSSKSLWYLTKFQNFMTLWMPYDTHCKYAMGMGMLCLGHGGAYFIMAVIKAGGWQVDWYAAVGACFAFVYMVALVVLQNFKDEEDDEVRTDAEEEKQRLIQKEREKTRLLTTKVITMVLLCCGPTLGIFGATTQNDILRKYLWMACFSFHFVFWLGTYLLTSDDTVFRDTQLVTSEGDFWSKGHPHMHIPHPNSTNGAKAAVVGKGDGLRTKPSENDWGDYEEGSSSAESSGSDVDTIDERSWSENSANSERSLPANGDAHFSAGAGQWPSDEPQFQDKVDKTKFKVKTSLQHTVGVIAMVWLALLIWVIVETVVIDEDSPLYRTYPYEQRLNVNWPGPLMRPLRISCLESTNYQFLADDYRVFKLQDGSVSDVECNVTTRIMDISSYCDTSCWPVVLQEDNTILDCQSGSVSQLLQDPYHALLLDVYVVAPGKPLSEQKLILVHETEKLVQYRWNQFRSAWGPELQLNLPLGSKGAALQALDSSGDSIMFFYGANADHNAIVRRDVRTMRPTAGPWALTSASAPLVGGCALNQARQALVLPQVPTMFDSPSVMNINMDASRTGEV